MSTRGGRGGGGAPAIKVSCRSMPDKRMGGLVFTIHGLDTSVVNLLRHALVADVPIVAADCITFEAYDGVQERETIALQFGRLPIRGSLPPGTHYSLPLEFVAPPISEKKHLTWLTSEAVKFPQDCPLRVVHYRSSALREAAFADTGFLLCGLHPGQQLKAVIHFRVGTGREHARWIAVRPQVKPLAAEGAFDISVETTGAVTATEAVLAALEAVHARLSRIAKAL